jgi:hypothetical protein
MVKRLKEMFDKKDGLTWKSSLYFYIWGYIWNACARCCKAKNKKMFIF